MLPRKVTCRADAIFNGRNAGRVVRHKGRGYIIAQVGGQRFHAHRLIWKWMTGEEPPSEIDHIDRDKSNNRWANLREATRSTNMHNAGMRSDNSTGFKGVHRTRDGAYCAQIEVQGKRHYLGRHKTPEEAHAAYVRAIEQMVY